MSRLGPPGAEIRVFWSTGNGSLVFDYALDNGEGTLSLRSGQTITRTKIGGRSPQLGQPYFVALTDIESLPIDLRFRVLSKPGQELPVSLVAEMRLALQKRIEGGLAILAGRAMPIDAATPWTSFDAASMPIWDLSFDNVANPILGSGTSYVQMTVFAPEEWERVTASKIDAPSHVQSVPIGGHSDPALLRTEYRVRVARWQSAKKVTPTLQPPSPEADQEWARKLFGTISRITLRKVRADLAPPEWRRSGKRSGPIWRE